MRPRDRRDTREPMSPADLAYGRSQPSELTAFPPESAQVRDTPDDKAMQDRPHEEGSDSHAPLVPRDRGQEYSQRWQSVQAEFVDEPQQAVKDADALVAEVIQMLATNFAEQR